MNAETKTDEEFEREEFEPLFHGHDGMVQITVEARGVGDAPFTFLLTRKTVSGKTGYDYSEDIPHYYL